MKKQSIFLKHIFVLVLLLLFGSVLTACLDADLDHTLPITLDEVPEYSGEPYVEINENKPFFTKKDKKRGVFENYSELDDLGRCGVAFANICIELMPTEERGEIGNIKPSGWHTIKYPDLIQDLYLYNRCHLIGYQLTGENDNEKNLITGTRYMNIEGMLPFENKVANYISRNKDCHVLYRVTPIFEGDNLLASGVLMEGYSVEDSGESVCFCIYAYNVQPGITIDYSNGDSKVTDESSTADETTQTYILNLNSKRFHYPDCKSVSEMKEHNKKEVTCSRQDLIDDGYIPCGSCSP